MTVDLNVAALEWARRGVPVFPLKADNSPATRNGFRDASTDPDVIKRMSFEHGIGAVPGPAFVVLDVDAKHGATLADLPDLGGDSMRYKTRSGGWHVWYRAEPGVDYGNGPRADIAPAIDIRFDRGYVAVAPTPGYELQLGSWDDAGSIMPAPAYAVYQGAGTAAAIFGSHHALDDRDVIPAGDQESAIHARAFQIARHRPRPSEAEAIAMLWQFVQDRCPNTPGREPWREQHVADKIKRAFAVPVESPISVDGGKAPIRDLSDVERRPIADLLSDTEAAFRRFVSGNDAMFSVLAVWVAHTHVFDAFDTTPYGHVYSPEPQCGKTRLLEVIEMTAANAMSSTSLTGPSLFRTIELQRPTLMLDEVDNLFRGKSAESERAADITAVLNGGFRRSGRVIRLVGKNHEPHSFATYCPKVLAGIGSIPDTLADRSIPFPMRRKLPHEQVERMRYRDALPELNLLRDQLTVSLEPHSETLADARPNLPSELSDRQADACEPLLAIAELAGGDWAERLRSDLVAIFEHAREFYRSGSADLVHDAIRAFYDGATAPATSLSAVDLAKRLNALDGCAYGDLNGGRGLSVSELRNRLRAYEILTRHTRTARVYAYADFVTVADRYPRHDGDEGVTV